MALLIGARDVIGLHFPNPYPPLLGGRPVVVWGSSLGAAATIFAAKDLGHQVSGYILECPYQDLHTAVRNRTEIYLPPLLDRVAYAGLLTVSTLVLPNADKISPIEA